MSERQAGVIGIGVRHQGDCTTRIINERDSCTAYSSSQAVRQACQPSPVLCEVLVAAVPGPEHGVRRQAAPAARGDTHADRQDSERRGQ